MMFKWIGNVLSGRYAHWNATNNAVVKELWERSERFPDELRQLIFRDFVTSSLLVVEYLLSPDKATEVLGIDGGRLIRQDPLQMGREQFWQLHGLLLQCMAGLFIKLNPWLAEAIKDGLATLTRVSPEDSEIMRFIESLEQFDLAPVGPEVWRRIVEIVGSDQGVTALEAYPFTMLLGGVLTDSFREIRRRISVAAAA